MLYNTAQCCCIAFCINAADIRTSVAARADSEASDVGDGEQEKLKRWGRVPGRKQVAARAAALKSDSADEDPCIDE